MTIKLVQLGEDGMACEGGVCAIPDQAGKAKPADAKDAKAGSADTKVSDEPVKVSPRPSGT